MKMYYIQGACILSCIWQLLLTTNALIFDRTTAKPRSICFDNQNADSFIHESSPNAVRNFLEVINKIDLFRLLGDTTVKPDGCRKAIDNNRHILRGYYGNFEYSLHCWEPSECTMIHEVIGSSDDFFVLLPVPTPTKAAESVRTIFLPLDSLNSGSYTFLPSTSQKNIFFVTSLLTGCSFFVAKPNDKSCNLIVIHTNYHCSDKSATGKDYNHEQAMAVLDEVQRTNHFCRYQIERRWVNIDWRPTVEAARYDYATRVFYYFFEVLGPYFLYASYVSLNSGQWHFCIKAAIPKAPPPTCYFI